MEQDPMTQAELNQKSQELRALWEEALNYLLDEAKKTLPEAEMEKLTAEQSAWETDMKTAIEATGKEYEGGSICALAVNTEAARLTEECVFNLYKLQK